MVYIFNQTIISIVCDFIPHETVLFYKRDLPWMNKEIKNWFMKRKTFFNCFRCSNNDKQLLDRLKDLQTQLNFLIGKSKGKYYSRIPVNYLTLVNVLRLTGPFWKVSLLAKKFHVFHRYVKTMNILQISRKKQNYSIHFLQTSAP